ncbi:telomere repeats-binding bouquet formation protein 1 isoform X2 [Nothobranchius furzeri]|uniref:Transcript variant X1 n=1 Tax=Nothobranchius furzeri TaxID=105023 RepID=A0A9D3C062_NOTFU|nr:transcript variant X1 [Nothobranchius furzeri]
MNRTSVCSSRRNATKTDLSLLLECLKFQMKSPDIQKQALLTIHSICDKSEDNVDLLRELGGVVFLYNLSKSSNVQTEVKAAAFYTLGTLAAANVYCKNSLCRKDIFTDIASLLMKEDLSLTQKRVSVYLLFVLVANNKSGQTLATSTGCLEILLDLFRSNFPLSSTNDFRTVSQSYQLWASVSSALCGCVNNPQNEEGQRICVAAFPIVKHWLQQISPHCTEVFQPICSFISMTVANNSFVQESFSVSGGLDVLTLTLVGVASAAETSILSYQLSVIIAKTLSACITDNPNLASGLSQYSVVSHLFSLLTSSHTDPDDILSVLLCIGLCTEASENHQSQLVQRGGLPIIITFLTEDTNEEVRKAAAFILQTCKQATLSLEVHGLVQTQVGNEEPLRDIGGFRAAAREMLQRIEALEKNQLKEADDEQEDVNDSDSTEGEIPMSQFPVVLPPQRREPIRPSQTQKRVQKGCDGCINLHKCTADKHNISQQKGFRKSQTNQWDLMCSEDQEGDPMSSLVSPLESSSESHLPNNQLFRRPLAVWQAKSEKMACSDNFQKNESAWMEKIPRKGHPVSHTRCAGCVLSFEEVTSRTFASLQSSCHNTCDMHLVLREATERFRRQHLNFALMKKQQNDAVAHTHTHSMSASLPKSQRSCVLLTPLNRKSSRSHCRTGHALTPLNRRPVPERRRQTPDSERRGSTTEEPSHTSSDHCSSRRKRQDFSREEVHYLLTGVKKHGFSWNTILWSYPFQPGRTNTDLAKKFRRLMKSNAEEGGVP